MKYNAQNSKEGILHLYPASLLSLKPQFQLQKLSFTLRIY